ncbi:anti-sigma factor [Cohnella hashimotonis]|uniref:Anti-sigma factor n=1 Tax=Cohnella hashimotonis TaxID=2826895 RepID=A0ABT6TF12_9BACL|nr:anti-sigma factor [Cohnella hashimotonis]MDI4645401.1 anti-sigma factor [Cohnella hashimotonis]
MSERSCGVPEERWIDLLAGRLHARDAEALLAHKQECRACGDIFAQWAELIESHPGSAPRLRAAAVDFTRQPGDEWALSAGRRRSLLMRAGAYAFARRATRAMLAAARRPALAAACGLGASVAVALVLLYSFARDNGQNAGRELSPAGYARLHEPDSVTMLSEPDTVKYEAGDRRSAGKEGGLIAGAKETLWLNMRTHELFLLMEGLLPSARTDVQAWASSGPESSNLGLLSFHDSRAHLYATNVRPEEWESVLLTIEPKGGSPTPTKPETASIRIRE